MLYLLIMNIEPIRIFIKKNTLIENHQTIIIGLSGGPDSVYLLYALHALQKEFSLTLIGAHLDHEWRTNSAQDVHFCANLCKKLEIPFVSKKASDLTGNFKKNGSQEALGRTLRRTFLQQVHQEYAANAIALAHHEQDQQETFFIRLIRGTTLSGLIGIRPRSGFYIRPLLHISKEDILAYLHEHDIAYLTDPTNNSKIYLRNRIRMDILPALQSSDQRFNANFLRTLDSLQETEEFLVDLTNQTFEAVAHHQEGIYYINTQKFLSLHPVMQQRMLMHWLIQQKVPFTPTAAFLNEIVRFLGQTKHAQHALHEKWFLRKEKGSFFIEH